MIKINGKEVPWKKGLTISELLEKTEIKNHCVVVRLNGKLISRPNFGHTIIKDNSEIFPLPMIAGG